jgi:hypothetical protein
MSTENHPALRRSDRSGKGVGGQLRQKMSASDAVQPQTNPRKRGASHLDSIPDGIPPNAMAPPPKAKKKSRVETLVSVTTWRLRRYTECQ